MTSIRGGFVPSDYDGRDYIWTSQAAAERSIQLHSPPIRDQGSEIDCCTSMAITTAMEALDYRNGSSTSLSPLFHYYYSRRSPRYLGPVTLRKALSTASQKGVCKLDLHDLPYTPEGALTKPTAQALGDASDRRLVAYDHNLGVAMYYALDSGNRVENWRQPLTSQYPVIAGIWTQSSYWEGLGMLDEEAGPNQGAHAVCILSFNDESQTFTVRDSRGESFANRGEWKMSYRIASSRRVVESWTINTLTYDD